MRRASVLVALVAVASAAGCRRQAEAPPREVEAPAAPAPTGLVKQVTIDDPESWWQEQGFVELHAPIHLPTNESRSDKITVWIMIPEGGRITVEEGALRYPAGTIADRVEYVKAARSEGPSAWTILDVRGTRIVEDGRELFHVYRPESGQVGARLKGFEWPRGRRAAQAEATAMLVDFMRETPIPYLGRALDEAGLAQLGVLNRCAPCHLHEKDRTPRDPRTASLPRGATDGHGFYHPLRVLDDVNAVEVHRAFDVNVDDPLVTVRCGAEPAEVRAEGEKRRYVCPEGVVPLGERDMARGLAQGDPLTKRVCESRRYLYDRMTDEARAPYAAAFRSCGIP